MWAAKIAAKFWTKLNFQVIAFVIGMSFMTVTHADEIQAQKYEGGELSELEALGYSPVRGSWVKNNDGEIQTDLMVQTWCVLSSEIPRIPLKCVFGIRSLLGRDPFGKPNFRTEDALDVSLKLGFKLFDDGDENCVSSLSPKQSVVAIGRWQWREKPKIGGYAHSIKQAWVIEPATKKFKEIPTSSVRCEINDDRD